MKVFISHSSKDKPFVRKLKRDLELNYIDTWLDEDELLPGDSLIDKLNLALNDSTHLLIILSPNSIKSDWVKFELENALKYVENETLEKIIPIHFRKCEIPEILKPLLNIDLTGETVYMRHGVIEFGGDVYYQNLSPLIRSINHGTKKLETSDKKEITGEKTISYEENGKQIVLNFRIVGYISISNFLANNISHTILSSYKKKPIAEIKPVVLPKQLKTYLGNLKFGDPIVFINENGDSIEGDFAMFQTRSNKIAMPKEIRDFLSIEKAGDRKVIIELKNKTIQIEKLCGT